MNLQPFSGETECWLSAPDSGLTQHCWRVLRHLPIDVMVIDLQAGVQFITPGWADTLKQQGFTKLQGIEDLFAPTERQEWKLYWTNFLRQCYPTGEFTSRLSWQAPDELVTLKITQLDEAPEFKGYLLHITLGISNKQQEQELDLLHGLARLGNIGGRFETSLEFALKEVCDTLGWNLGEVWLPNPANQQLECSTYWYSNSPQLNEFRHWTKSFVFAYGAGLPGRVWKTQRHEWDVDVSSEADHEFLRAALATKVGLKSALGIPICVDEEVIAVMVFFMLETKPEDLRLVRIISSIASQLGTLAKIKRLEESIDSSTNNYQTLFENLVEGVFQTSLDGKYIYCNASLAHIYGYDSVHQLLEDLNDIGKQLYLDPNRRQEFIELIQKQKVVYEFESQVRHKSGKVIWISETARAVYQSNGKLSHFEGFVREVTAQKALRNSRPSATETQQAPESNFGHDRDLNQMHDQRMIDQLKQSESNLRELNAKKDKMMLMISHDLRMPFQALSNFLHNQQANPLFSQKNKGNTLGKALNYVIKYTDNLLNYAMLQGGVLRANPNYFDLNQLLDQLIEFLNETIIQRSIQIIKTDFTQVIVFADLQMCQSIFLNILSNAIKYTPQNGQVRLHVSNNSGLAQVQIRDSGRGMDSQTLKSLFDINQKATPGFSSKSGTGLGLMLCKEMIDSNGGKISIQSQLDNGTLLVVELPTKPGP